MTDKTPKISICVPTYEMKGKGLYYLFLLLKSVKRQNYKNYEVVISDHSQNTEIEDSVNLVKTMNIKYLRNEKNRGNSSCNINNAIKNSTGEIIKPIFQDDVIINENYLSKIVSLYEENQDLSWGASGFIHIDDESNVYGNEHPPLIPRLNDNLVTGVNTFGCPSVCFFKKSLPHTLFDENLVWLMDCEFYHRLNLNFGGPTIINDYDMGVRIWKDSFTGDVDENIKNKEEEYVIKKFNINGIEEEEISEEESHEEPEIKEEQV